MKAAIFGIGRMGRAIGYAMDKLGYDLIVFEPDRGSVGILESLIDKNVKQYDSIDIPALDKYCPAFRPLHLKLLFKI